MIDEMGDRYGKCPQYRTESGTVVGGTWDDYDAYIGIKTIKVPKKSKAKKIDLDEESIEREVAPDAVEETEAAQPKERVYFGKYKKQV